MGHKGRLAEILFQSFLREAAASNSGMVIGRDANSLTLSVQYFLCGARSHPSSKAPWKMILERVSWHDLPGTFEFSSADSSLKRFLWTHEEVDIVLVILLERVNNRRSSRLSYAILEAKQIVPQCSAFFSKHFCAGLQLQDRSTWC